MSEVQKTLFIGGTADGQWLPVHQGQSEHRLPSFTSLPEDPDYPDESDPRPEKLPVVEIYLPVSVEHEGGLETVFALNALSDEAIRTQLVKHFGAEVTFQQVSSVASEQWQGRV
jgi:hypothetical protein